MTIASLIVDVAANTAKLQTDVQKIHGSLDSVGAVASKMGSMLAGAFTVTAITGAATKVLDYASTLNNLSAQTGLTRQSLQEMSHAAALTGTSLEAFTNAAFKLGVNLAGGGLSVVGAVEKLGLSYRALQQMAPDQQFNAIAAALGTVQSAQERNKLAVELFGKSAAQILPAIAQGYDDLRNSAITAGDAQLDALGMAGDALDSFYESAKNMSVQLAGGLIIAFTEINSAFQDFVRVTGNARKGVEEIASHLEVMGLKTATVPRVLNETSAAARNLPQPLASASMSVQQLAAAEKSLTEQVNKKIEANKAAAKAQEELQRNQERFAASIQRLDTAEWIVPFKVAVEQASFELEELTANASIAANGMTPFKAAVQEADLTVSTFGDSVRDTFTMLPTVILQAIQGGGGVLKSAGAFIGTNLMTSFSEKYGALIKDALPFGLGNAINALLPTLGALFGPVVEKVAGFFRRIFGGPSEEELAGRQRVADFEAQLASLLTQTQKNEAGNESWKMTVIAIRDAYMLAGKTEAEALAAAETLWKSSKFGANAVEAAIAAINAVMKQTEANSATTSAAATTAYGAIEGAMKAASSAASNVAQFVGQVSGAIHAMDRDIEINVRTSYTDGGMPDWGGAQARGGDYFVTRPTLFLAGEAGPERASFSGAGRSSMPGNDAMVDEVRRLVRDLPRAMKVAVADAIVLQGA